MRSISSLAVVVGVLGGAALAACGAPRSPAPSPPAAGSASAAAAAPGGSANAAPSATSASPVASEAPLPPPEPRPAGQKSTTVQRTAYDAELRAIGLDPSNLPPLGMMSRGQKLKLMTMFGETMGFAPASSGGDAKSPPLASFASAPCFRCHETQSFSAVTRRMEIVDRIWTEWVMKTKVQGGGNVFCDSCHEKNVKTIDRRDEAAVRAFMRDEYVGKLAMKDGSATTCETCHGQGFQASIFDKVWHVKAGAR